MAKNITISITDKCYDIIKKMYDDKIPIIEKKSYDSFDEYVSDIVAVFAKSQTKMASFAGKIESMIEQMGGSDAFNDLFKGFSDDLNEDDDGITAKKETKASKLKEVEDPSKKN